MPTLHQSIHDAINAMTSLKLNLQMAEDQKDKHVIQANKDADRMILILHDMSKHID